MMSSQQPGTKQTETDGVAQAKLLCGRLLCVVGLVLIPPGAYFVSVAMEFATLCLGMVGFYLGARRLGVAVVALSVVAAVAGLLLGQGYIPTIVNPLESDVDGLRRGMEAITGG